MDWIREKPELDPEQTCQAIDEPLQNTLQPITVSVVIVNWNTRDLLAQCIRCVYEKAGSLNTEVIVVDNASLDGSLEMLRRDFPEVSLLANPENVGFARANNQAVALSRAPYVLLLNSDAFPLEGALEALVEIAERAPGIGVVGAQLRNADGTFQASHTRFPNLWREFLILTKLGRVLRGRYYPSCGPDEKKGPRVVDYVEGACMLVRRAAYSDVGGLDEGYFMYSEEVDFCHAMRQRGWQVWYHPGAKVTHLGGASSRNRPTGREGDLYRGRVRFFRKHYGNAATWALKTQIYALTAVKVAIHGVLRLLTGGRLGRAVISLPHLVKKLKGV